MSAFRETTKKIETITFRVDVLKRDIEEGECRLAHKCMHKVAIERTLRKMDPSGQDHRVRVDAADIKFNLRGYKYEAHLPKAAKVALVRFDREAKARRKAQAEGIPFASKVLPHTYKIEARKLRRIKPMTRERQNQINAARRKRFAEGRKDRAYNLRERIVGFGSV